MSKRKRNKSGKPNLPEETLERARQEAGLAPKPQREEVGPEEDEAEVEEIETAAPIRAPKAEAPRRRDLPQPAQPAKRKAKPRRSLNYQDMSQDDMGYLLDHPTKVVTEDALRQQYGYVLADLRSMALLAAALFVALIVIAAVIIR